MKNTEETVLQVKLPQISALSIRYSTPDDYNFLDGLKNMLNKHLSPESALAYSKLGSTPLFEAGPMQPTFKKWAIDK